MALAVDLMVARNIPSKQTGDIALLQRIAASQDRAAFADLFDAYGPRVKAFMMRKGATP